MAGRIRDEDVKLVREASPIDVVVGDYLQLRNAGGGNLKGLCPFHDEKSPSFQVTPARGLYHCFGCAAGGDVITFVMNVDHIGFTEAVERLAARANIELRYTEGGYTARTDRSERSRLLDAHRAAVEFYVEQLATPEAKVGRELLLRRGFDQAAIAEFRVGYAPGGWDLLVRHLRGRGFTDEELLKGGLASQGRRGPIDRFRGRLMWPIADITGDVIGFGARRLNDDQDSPKYLNTPETPIYKKSSVLYGLDRAKRQIAAGQRVVIVEGYTDVMACHLADVKDAVAACGTSFGEEHFRILRRLLAEPGGGEAYSRGSTQFNHSVVFTFDGDAAGRKAALRAFMEEQRFLSQTYVAVQPDGLDPCELRMAQGDAAVRELIANREPLVMFAVRSALQAHDLDTPDGRVNALRTAVPMLANFKDHAMLVEYARMLSGWLGMSEDYVLREVSAARAGRGGSVPASRQGRQDRERDRSAAPGQGALPGVAARAELTDNPVARSEREALKIALQMPVLAGPVFDDLDAEEFTQPAYARIRELIAVAGGAASATDSRAWLDSVLDQAPDAAARGLVTELAVERLHTNGEADHLYVTRCLSEVRSRSVSRRIAEVKGRLQRLNPVTQTDEYNRLFGELIALEQYRHGLLERL